MLLEPPPGLLDPSTASLARELAQDIRPAAAILQDYGFSGPGDPLWIELQTSLTFRRLLEEATREWNAADTTKRRINMKAQASIEQALPELHAMIINKGPTADRVAAAKLMKSLAGMDTVAGVPGAPDGAGGVTVKIIIGDHKVEKLVTAQTPVLEHESAGVAEV